MQDDAWQRCMLLFFWIGLCFRTKALVLELLAAVCLVSGGHRIIIRAFDNFKEVSLLLSESKLNC